MHIYLTIWINRTISDKIIAQAALKPAVLVTGPRQVGKSSLLKHHFTDMKYISFDDHSLAADAVNNPKSFIEKFIGPRAILDEIQYVPEMFRHLKYEHCESSL